MKKPRLYACIISSVDSKELVKVAEKFAYRIEALEDGIIFEVSGLERLIGEPEKIAKKIDGLLRKKNLSGRIAISENPASSMLRARNSLGASVASEKGMGSLPVSSLEIDEDTLRVFSALGINTIGDLRQIPEDALISRYGTGFQKVIDDAKSNGRYILTPNLSEHHVNWEFHLDHGVADFEQLIFILRHGLEKVFAETSKFGHKSEQLDISLSLYKLPEKRYRIKASFPNLDIKFWLKIIGLKITGEPPGAEIIALKLTSHFARPRTAQNGLFSAVKPQPESLQLSIAKLKNLLGKENVGVPAILDQRLPEAFCLDAAKMPLGKESKEKKNIKPAIALNIFQPPLPAEAITNKNRLLYIRTASFKGKVVQYSGIWKASSQWWGPLGWKTQEWDIELENGGLYRLLRSGEKWFITGEYD